MNDRQVGADTHLFQYQRIAVDALRERILMHFIAEVEAFYRQYPELRVKWSCEVSATQREEQ
jgi:hypothetical protein